MHLSVFYRRECSFDFATQPPTTIGTNIFEDYMPSPTTRPAKTRRDPPPPMGPPPTHARRASVPTTSPNQGSRQHGETDTQVPAGPAHWRASAGAHVPQPQALVRRNTSPAVWTSPRPQHTEVHHDNSPSGSQPMAIPHRSREHGGHSPHSEHSGSYSSHSPHVAQSHSVPVQHTGSSSNSLHRAGSVSPTTPFPPPNLHHA